LRGLQLEEVGLEVGRYDDPVGRDLLREPTGDRAAPGPDLQTSNPWLDPQVQKLLARTRVERDLEPSQPYLFLVPAMLVDVPVARVGSPARIAPPSVTARSTGRMPAWAVRQTMPFRMRPRPKRVAWSCSSSASTR